MTGKRQVVKCQTFYLCNKKIILDIGRMRLIGSLRKQDKRREFRNVNQSWFTIERALSGGVKNNLVQ